jgi:predicted amidohydrolase YtcJ
MHAIGDRAIRNAIDAIEATVGDDRNHRHRIEHLEYADESDTARLGTLGIVASMQPVHVDPAILDNWVAMLGDDRAERGFAWPEYRGGGATLAFSTDSPTAPYQPLPNMYIATTRRSPSDPTLAPHRPDFAVTLSDAITHATRDAAWASWGEGSFGSLRAGLSADLVVLDRDPFEQDPEVLPEIRPVVTISRGEIVHDARDS